MEFYLLAAALLIISLCEICTCWLSRPLQLVEQDKLTFLMRMDVDFRHVVGMHNAWVHGRGTIGLQCWNHLPLSIQLLTLGTCSRVTVENALFKSSGDICWSPLPSSLLDQLSVDKRDSNGFFSSRLVCRTRDSSYNSTDPSRYRVQSHTVQLHFCGYTRCPVLGC